MDNIGVDSIYWRGISLDIDAFIKKSLDSGISPLDCEQVISHLRSLIPEDSTDERSAEPDRRYS